jgi:hypothetical protein
LKERDYKNLCKICDEILLSKHSNPTRIAISWLHVLREHPEFLKKYSSIFSKTVCGSKYLNLKLSIKIIVHGIAYFFRAVLTKNYSISSKKAGDNLDYIFISHIVNESQAGFNNDSYFGNLPYLLSQKGKSVLIVLLNHSSVGHQKLANKWVNPEIPRIVLGKGISTVRGIQIYYNMFLEFIWLRFFSDPPLWDHKKRVLKRASIEALSSGTFFNLMIKEQIADLTKSFRPTNLVLSYEGHAFERMAYYGAREAKSDIVCMGYQHSALFKLQHAFKRMLTSQYNPQVILTSSLMATNELTSDPKLDDIQIGSVGSNRAFESHNIQVKHNSKNTCLVLPEGFMSECVLLFDFSLQCAILNPETTFIWRIHPIMTFDQIMATNSQYDQLPKNIFLSDKELDEDILRCQFALYRGSTAIIKAGAAGVKPIYYKKKKEGMTIDPLYRIDEGKAILNDPTEFNKLVIDSKNCNEQSQKIMKYCHCYYDPIDSTFLLNFDKI